MAVKIAERSTYWQNGTNSPSATGDYRYYWMIYYEQTDNDKSLNRSKVIVEYYLQTYKTQSVDGWDTIILPAGTSRCFINDTLIGSIGTDEGIVMIGSYGSLQYLGSKSTYVTHNSDGTATFKWQGDGLNKGTKASYYTLPTITQGGTTPEEPGDDIEFTPDTLTTDFYTGGTSNVMARMRIVIDSIAINDNGTMTVKYGIEVGNGNDEEWDLAAYAAYINGSQKTYVHQNEDYTFIDKTWYNKISGSWGWYRLATRSDTITVANSFTMKVKGMFNYGWTQSRWDSNTGCVSKETTIYVTIPVKPEYNALIKTANGWKKGFTYIKIGEEWRECDIYYKVGSTWKRGSTE